jgi:hypothetical protein
MIVRFDLRELERDLGAEVNSFLREFANELVNQLKQEAPVGATGDLRRSIQIFTTGDGVVYLGTRIGYAMDVWKGTEPHIADFDAIEVWARRKLGSEAAAGPVWRKIAREGTEPNDFVGRSIDQAIDRVA